jgi:hypothetical protein
MHLWSAVVKHLNDEQLQSLKFLSLEGFLALQYLRKVYQKSHRQVDLDSFLIIVLFISLICFGLHLFYWILLSVWKVLILILVKYAQLVVSILNRKY